MKKAFTLIELLIVVAIIAILAAIAVPNFLEAQTRSKVSRVKADMRTLATGLESYYVDNNKYPQSNGDATPGFNAALSNVAQNISAGNTPSGWVLERLSTPIAYLTNGLIPDAFPTQFAGIPNNSTGVYALPLQAMDTDQKREANKFLKYSAVSFEGGVTAEVGTDRNAQSVVFIYSSGPDNTKTELRGSGVLGTAGFGALPAASYNNVYDSSNGTISQGDVFRAAGQASDDRGKFLFDAVSKQN